MANELTAMMGVFARVRSALICRVSLVAVDNGKLNVHVNEIGALGFGFVYPVLSVCSLDDRIARAA
jgi:hypothetical protein